MLRQLVAHGCYVTALAERVELVAHVVDLTSHGGEFLPHGLYLRPRICLCRLYSGKLHVQLLLLLFLTEHAGLKRVEVALPNAGGQGGDGADGQDDSGGEMLLHGVTACVDGG